MNIYEVTFTCPSHCNEPEEQSPMRVSAKDGDAAVKKARKRIAWAQPTLEALKCIVKGVD